MKKNLVHLVRFIALFLAVLFLFYTVRKYGGFVLVGGRLRSLGFLGAAGVILNSFLWMMLYTRAWSRFFIGQESGVPFGPLLRVKIAGESVNLTTPAGFAAGDPVRVLLLRSRFGAANRLRSVVVDRVMHIFATFVFCAAGTAMLFFQSVVLPPWLFWMGLGGCVFYSLMACMIAWLLLRLLRGQGLGWVGALLERSGLLRRFPRLAEFFERLRIDLLPYADHPKGRLLEAFLLHFVGRVLGACENMIISLALLGVANVQLSLILAAFTSFFLLVFSFVPGGIGVIEEMYAAFFQIFGADPAIGFTVQLVRRMRAVFWVFVGFCLIDIRELLRLRGQQKMAKSPGD